MKEPELVIVPMGATNEAGVKQKRKAIKFFRNSKGQGQFGTSDAKIQSYLDNHPWVAAKKLLCIGEELSAPVEIPTEEQRQSEGMATSADPIAPIKRGTKPKKPKSTE